MKNKIAKNPKLIFWTSYFRIHSSQHHNLPKRRKSMLNTHKTWLKNWKVTIWLRLLEKVQAEAQQYMLLKIY